MASSCVVRLDIWRSDISDSVVKWDKCSAERIDGLPQIFWGNSSPWREANLWLFERARSRELSIKTLTSNAAALSAYASWLESEGVDWWDFPRRKSERCLVKFRGFLIQKRSTGELSPSTVSARMRCIIAFYRWLYGTGLLSTDWPLWNNEFFHIPINNEFGLQRTLEIKSTDLSIPNRSRKSISLEGGLMPVSGELRSKILDLAKRLASEELKLMLALGFYTGLRLGSICDLKIGTLINAVPDPGESNMYWLAVGPSAAPSVSTKYDIDGQVIIPKSLLNELLNYGYSIKRLKREALAENKNKNVLFLTRYGNPYTKPMSSQSSSVNAEMYRLRKNGLREGLPINNFKFHQTRATFATSVAEIGVRVGGGINAVALVKELLLHKNEATSLNYIKFIESTKLKSQMANQFSKTFFGKLLERGFHD